MQVALTDLVNMVTISTKSALNSKADLSQLNERNYPADR